METRKSLSGTVVVNFGWDAYPRQYSAGLIAGLMSKGMTSVDCDASAIFCGKDGKPISLEIDQCCVYYKNGTMFNSAVVHSGDNQTGDKLYDETITINLDKIPSTICEIILTLDLLKEKKKTGFGKIQNAFIKLIDMETNEELQTNSIVGLGAGTNLIIAGRIIRKDRGWVYKEAKECYEVNSINQLLCTL